MKAKTNLTAAAIICAIVGVLLGFFIKNFSASFSLSRLIEIIFIIFGVITLFSSIPEFFIAVANISSLPGKLSLISASIGVLFGFVMIFYHSRIIIPIIAAYLVIFPVVRILITRPKELRNMTAKALVPKIIIGILLIVFFPAASGLADTVFRVGLKIVGWAIIVISIVALVSFLIFLYARPKASKKADDGTIYLDDEDFNDKNK